MVVFGLLLWIAVRPSAAQAAVRRAIAAANAPVTRVYRVRVVRSGVLRDRVRECTLFSSSGDRFVVMWDTPLQPMAVGCDGVNRWYAIGPRVGQLGQDLSLPAELLFERINLRQLQLNRLLARIPSDYTVQQLAAEPLPGDPAVTCQPVEARLNGARETLPETIRLWTHPETGLIARMLVIRRGDNPQDSPHTDLRFVEQRDSDPEFFSLSFHQNADPGRTE